ncbi:MAG: polar amino acid transporter permease [Microbacteriaceae bacterium]|jgi:glutamate transport system permease protein|nr:polar amino acid transporter permease [Microbacteriaceae bacterium]
MSTSVLYDAPGPKARRMSRISSIVGLLLIAAFVAWLVMTLAAPRISANGAAQPGMFDSSRWDILNDLALWRGVADGVVATLRMAAVGAVLAIVIGVLFSFGRTALSAYIRVPTTIVLEFFRGMPVLLMMLFILLVFSSGAYAAGVLALGIYNGAIIGEVLRAGIASLPRGQRESGLALGFTPLRTRFLIEFPQAFRQMLPIIIAQLVVLLKDTSLAYVIGYPELLRKVVNQMSNFYGNRYFFTLFFLALVIYLAINLTLSWIARVVARRTASGYTRKGGPKRGGPTTPLTTIGAPVVLQADGGEARQL